MDARLYQLLRECTVRVSSGKQGTRGTGFFVAPGLILTCTHVLTNPSNSNSLPEVYFNGLNYLARIIASYPYPDFSLIQIELTVHPCVYLQGDIFEGDLLYSFGYTDEYLEGDSITAHYEGPSGNEQGSLLKFKQGQVRPGLSGSPILNTRTGGVCGIIKKSRDRTSDLGGRGIPLSVIYTHILTLEAKPDLEVKNVQFHEQDDRWWSCLAEKRYLRALISNLEKRAGILEFVELSAQTDDPNVETQHSGFPKHWTYEPEFTLLIRDTPGSTENRKMRLNSIKEALNIYPRFVLTGEPGAGKTTIIRRLALDAAKVRLKNSSAPLPLLLELASWNQEGSPFDFIQAHWPLDTDMRDMLTRNKGNEIFLFLDGLNEMGGKGPSKAKSLNSWLEDWNTPGQVIVTCRTSDYRDEVRLNLPQVTVEDMDESQVRQFVKHYLDTNTDGFLEFIFSKGENEGNEDNANSRSLFRLVQSPFILTSMILIYRNFGELKANRGKLFQELVRTLWRREERRGTVAGSSIEDANVDLSQLAYAMIDDDMPTKVSIHYALRHVRSEQILKVAQSANFVDIVDEEINFHHQLLQEYFTAVKLAPADVPNKLRRNPRKKEFFIFLIKIFAKNFYKPAFWKAITAPLPYSALSLSLHYNELNIYSGYRWYEVITMLCGIEPNADSILLELLKLDHLTLAGQCIASGGSISESTRRKALDYLLKVLHGGDEDRRSEAAEALGEIGDVIALPSLFDALDDETSAVFHQSVRKALIKIDDVTVTVKFFDILRQGPSSKWGAAAETLGERQFAAAVPYLLEALQDKDWRGQWAAIDALEKIGDEVAVSGLLDVLQDKTCQKRAGAAMAVGRILGRAAIPRLLEALQDKGWDDQWAAASALGQIKDPSVVPALIEVLHNESESLRGSAAWALGEIGDPRAVPYLVQLLTDISGNGWSSEKGPTGVADTAIESLKQIGTEEAMTAIKEWPVKLKSLLHDVNVERRMIVIRKLGYIKDPISIPWLIECLKEKRTKDKWGNRIADEAARSLERIGTPDSLASVEAWRKGRKP